MKRDELNVLAENYYSVMDISEDKKKKREDDAWDLFELFMLLFYYFKEAQNNEVEDYSFILPRFQIDLQEVVSNITAVDDYLISYFAVLALAVYTTTLEHLGSEYYLSDDRAANLALNESNTINNYLDVREAQNEGYTHKKWVAELDERTRPDHIMMDGTIVPIDGYFEFSDCKMFAPHDVVNGTPAQNANCRCSLSYLTLENSITDAIIEEPKDPDIVIPNEKITKYLLKPNAKHYREFADVGYSEERPEELKQDIMNGYDYNKAQDFKDSIYGKEFVINMSLGINKKKPFKTAWIIKNGAEKPSLVTAYRISEDA